MVGDMVHLREGATRVIAEVHLAGTEGEWYKLRRSNGDVSPLPWYHHEFREEDDMFGARRQAGDGPAKEKAMFNERRGFKITLDGRVVVTRAIQDGFGLREFDLFTLPPYLREGVDFFTDQLAAQKKALADMPGRVTNLNVQKRNLETAVNAATAPKFQLGDRVNIMGSSAMVWGYPIEYMVTGVRRAVGNSIECEISAVDNSSMPYWTNQDKLVKVA